jgi:hypothetical protein
MASDPALRERILGAMQPGVVYSAETVGGLLRDLGVACPSSRGRRAVESLHYGHRQLILGRPRDLVTDERGWQISRRI